ncbi:MAG: hypothetical protein J6D09_06515 [Clostridia bacterium]|nr:hypothetical protein [Clostridia bacterium]
MEKTAELVMVNVAEEDGIVIRYFLYEDTVENRPSFSIECRCGEDSAFLPDVTSIPERAREIFEMLVRGKVTPTSAFDVIEEILS